MGKIICLMGKSSSGKDTIYKRLLEAESLHLQKIIPYTTRPIRKGEMEGVEYHFTDETGYLALKQQGKIAEERCYSTVHGLWRYFTVLDENVCQEQDSYILIGTLEAYVSLCQFLGKDKVLPIYIHVSDGVRICRALKREQKQEEPKYQEMCRRFLTDSEDFSDEKLALAGVDRWFWNDDKLEDCIAEICQYLEQIV